MGWQCSLSPLLNLLPISSSLFFPHPWPCIIYPSSHIALCVILSLHSHGLCSVTVTSWWGGARRYPHRFHHCYALNPYDRGGLVVPPLSPLLCHQLRGYGLRKRLNSFLYRCFMARGSLFTGLVRRAQVRNVEGEKITTKTHILTLCYTILVKTQSIYSYIHLGFSHWKGRLVSGYTLHLATSHHSVDHSYALYTFSNVPNSSPIGGVTL